MPCIRPSPISSRTAKARRAIALALLVGSVGVLVIAAQRGHAALPVATAVTPATPWAAAPAQLVATTLPASITPAPGPGRIALQRGEIVIAVRAMPLAEAARQLAAATDTTLDAADVLGAAPAPVTLHWQGRSAADAWQQLLGADANYAARCDARGCRVRITGLLAATPPDLGADRAAGPVRAARLEPSPLAPTPAPPATDPPGLFPSDG